MSIICFTCVYEMTFCMKFYENETNFDTPLTKLLKNSTPLLKMLKYLIDLRYKSYLMQKSK